MSEVRRSLVVLVVAAVAASCTTKQARRVEPGGFLGDYSMLKEGEGSEPLLFYAKPDLDMDAYDKVWISEVSVWAKDDSKLGGLAEEDQKALTQLLYKALHDELSPDYEMVEEAGSGVIEVRAALTEAKGSTVVLHQVTTLVPQMALITSGIGLATGTAPFVGAASAEMEVRDSVTRERLFAGVDRRVGQKSPSGVFRSWSHIEGAFQVWAEQMREEFRKRRSSEEE